MTNIEEKSRCRPRLSKPPPSSPPVLTKTDYVVVADAECMEAVAIAKTFGHLISEMTHEPTHTMSFPKIDKADVPHLFVILSPAKMLLNSSSSPKMTN